LDDGKKIKYKLSAVKRGGKIQEFDEKKIYKSCHSACMSVHRDKKLADEICKKTMKEIKKWASKKDLVTSDQIFIETIKILKKYDKDSAFMYETHRDIN